MLKNLLSYIVYFFCCTLLIWIFLHQTYSNNNITNKYFYWFIPTAVTVFLSIMFHFITQYKNVFIKNTFYIFIFSLISINIVFALIEFCETSKNPSFLLKSIILTVNFLASLYLLLLLKSNKVKINFIFLLFFLMINLFMNLHYELGIYFFYDNIYFYLTDFKNIAILNLLPIMAIKNSF